MVVFRDEVFDRPEPIMLFFHRLFYSAFLKFLPYYSLNFTYYSCNYSLTKQKLNNNYIALAIVQK